MLVGLHEAIHGVGTSPSTMNTGAQPDAWLYGHVVGLRDS
jgi:hypothetical protein